MKKNNVELSNKPFEIKDCALAALATGKSAQNLKELRDLLLDIDANSIYYHFWGGQLKPRFDDPEYHNDFASWTRHALHDGTLAERLSAIDPTDFQNLEDLRTEIVEIIEERLDENDHIPWCEPDEKFHFVTSQIVVFNTKKTIEDPRMLVKTIPNMTRSSIFYHFIDARRRTPENIDDFRAWLKGFDGQYNFLCDMISTIDPFFATLTELRKHLYNIVKNYFEGE
ncbi:MAG: hypothetical protein B6D63_04970 [Candidatus Latescibacteria bacterium 4484_7]|nr:MAG: hypothetical protein B6D63_04970 [Candidatus Latescibacteria bacterium 4484_7]RKZ08189.1 MAG: hypothetical protein DRQ05_01940 [bacterium]